MVIYLVEHLRQVYSTNIYCTAVFNRVINDATKAANGKITTNTFLKPNWLSAVDRNTINVLRMRCSNTLDRMGLWQYP